MSAPGNGHHAPNSVPPEWTRRILWTFFAGCVILVVLDLFVIHRHEYHSWERIPAFHALWGFVGLAFLIQASKGLRRLVMRPEDYYDGPEAHGGFAAADDGGDDAE